MVVQVSHEEILRHAKIAEDGRAFVAARPVHVRPFPPDDPYIGFVLFSLPSEHSRHGYYARVPVAAANGEPPDRRSVHYDILNGMQTLEYVAGGGEVD